MFSNFVFVVEAIVKDGKLFGYLLRTAEGRIIDVKSESTINEPIEKVFTDFIVNVHSR